MLLRMSYHIFRYWHAHTAPMSSTGDIHKVPPRCLHYPSFSVLHDLIRKVPSYGLDKTHAIFPVPCDCKYKAPDPGSLASAADTCVQTRLHPDSLPPLHPQNSRSVFSGIPDKNPRYFSEKQMETHNMPFSPPHGFLQYPLLLLPTSPFCGSSPDPDKYQKPVLTLKAAVTDISALPGQTNISLVYRLYSPAPSFRHDPPVPPPCGTVPHKAFPVLLTHLF